MAASPTALRLFDDRARTDPSPAPRAESHFGFLNRVDRPYFAAVRDLLEDLVADDVERFIESI